MHKAKIGAAAFLLCALSTVSGAGQSVLTNPSGNQAVTQPPGSTLSVNNITVPGSLNLGSGTYIPQLIGSGGNISLGYIPVNGQWATTNIGTLIIHDAADNFGGSRIDTNNGDFNLTSSGDGEIVLDGTPGNGGVRAKISGGLTFDVMDTDGGNFILCAVADTDFVGVGSPGSCNAYDLFDVSHREAFGNGYMHWFADSALVTWDSSYSHLTSGWNTGISNPSNGVLSFDSTVDHDGKAAIKVGTITLAPISSGTAGSITFSDGTVQSTAWNGTTLGGDYAESIDVLGDRTTYEPGDVIVIDDSETGKFDKSCKPYSKMVAGVYSTKPGLVGRRMTADRPNKEAEVPMAMMGIAPTKVNTENGAIEPGDLLVSSSTPGYAMKGTDRDRLMGAVIGKALASLKSGSGMIEALISLQ